ncbi:MAG: hypothetical protein WC455_11245 [Dehalococcoidia bacterium]
MSEPLSVQCPTCLRWHVDQGRRQTCRYCGLQPLPSFSYSYGSVFYPVIGKDPADDEAKRLRHKIRDRLAPEPTQAVRVAAITAKLEESRRRAGSRGRRPAQ